MSHSDASQQMAQVKNGDYTVYQQPSKKRLQDYIQLQEREGTTSLQKAASHTKKHKHH